MKKFTLLAAVAMTTAGFAQTHNHIDDDHFGPANPKMCVQHEMQAKFYQENPAAQVADAADQAAFQQEYEHYWHNEFDPNARSSYTIPVVVHIVHLGGVDNISNEQVYDAIATLNEDFAMTNSDLGNTVAPFDAITGHADMEFVLATKDPSGNCHLGITRTYSVHTNHDGDNDIIDAIQAQHGNWPANKYMNIIVCQDPNGAAGYTYNPSGWIGGMTAGIFMRHDYMGTIGTSAPFARHTLSHEVGHWFNLSHVWGGNNNPGAGSCGGSQDQVDDTPPTVGWQACDVNGNTCSNDVASSNGYWSTDVIDNVQNIMEYSYCSTMFTNGQAARMQTAANSSTAGRNNLWTASNLAATGTDGPGQLCNADFSSGGVTTICAGESVGFYDESFHTVTSRNWTFTGGTPASSTAQDPVITYNTPGVYTVALNVSDGSSSLTETKTNYIVVLGDPGTAPPYSEGFETISAVPNNVNWMVWDENNSGTWELTATAGSQGSSSSAKLDNFGNTDGTVDELLSETIDLGNVSASDNIVFSFDFAYKKRASGNSEKLQFYISKDCGETWVLRKQIQGSGLGDDVQTSPYTPSSDEEWTTIDVTNINSEYFVSNFRYKFVFTNDGGNNIYIDNINLYPASMTAIESADATKKLTVYPNPTNGLTQLTIQGETGVDYEISLNSALGQQLDQIFQGQLSEGINQFEFDTEELAKGVYLISIKTEDSIETIKLIKE